MINLKAICRSTTFQLMHQSLSRSLTVPRLYKLEQRFYRLAVASAGTSVHACSHSSNRKGSICSSQRRTATPNVLQRHHRKPALEGPHTPSSTSAPAGAMGSEGWPAPAAAMEAGRTFLQSAAQQAKRVLIVPDKDADGLCAGSIIARTLTLLGCTAEVVVRPVTKGEHVHQDAVRDWIRAAAPSHLIITDLGSRSGPIVEGLPTLVIDHHQPDGMPDGAVAVSAHGIEPIATSALLAYELCRPLHASVASQLDWLALVGTVGDLQADGVKQFASQVPEVQAAFSKYGRTHVTETVSLLNAARRCAACDVTTSWQAIASATCPKDIATGKSDGAEKLKEYRSESSAELNRCAKAPPRFSDDGRIAMLRISSGAQVHPLLAQRWLGRLRSQDKAGKLQMVMCANDAYLPGKVNFSARAAQKDADLIQLLKQAVQDSGLECLAESLGGDFARGHAQATGGMVPTDVFPQLLQALNFSEAGLAGTRKRKAGTATAAGQGTDAAPPTPDPKQRKLTSFFQTAKSEGKKGQ